VVLWAFVAAQEPSFARSLCRQAHLYGGIIQHESLDACGGPRHPVSAFDRLGGALPRRGLQSGVHRFTEQRRDGARSVVCQGDPAAIVIPIAYSNTAY
jgi:hypothetical protein